MASGSISRELDIPIIGGTIVAHRMPAGCWSFEEYSYEWYIKGIILGPDRRYKGAPFVLGKHDVEAVLDTLPGIVRRMTELEKIAGDDEYVEPVEFVFKDSQIVVGSGHAMLRIWFYGGGRYKHGRSLSVPDCKRFLEVTFPPFDGHSVKTL